MLKKLLGAVFAALALRLIFVFCFPAGAGDTATYEQLARNWLDHGVYGLWLNGVLTPVDIRAPGYPAFLAAIFSVFGRSNVAVLLVQVFVDLLTCLLTGGIAAYLAPEKYRARVMIAAVWLAALCPFVANYTAAVLTEVLATFLTTASLLMLLLASGEADAQPPNASSGRLFFFGAFFAGLGALVRPETPLLLATTGVVLCFHWWRVPHWPRLFRAGVFMALGLALPLLPWAARNVRTLHEVQFLAARHAELPGELVPHGFYAWTNTWLVRFRDVYLLPWKLEDEPISIDDVNPDAFDSSAERDRVAKLLDRYDEEVVYTPELDAEFAALARERTARHPLRTYVWVPLQRCATMWFTPRVELLPYSGHLFPLADAWADDPVDFSVTIALGFLNFVFVGLALAGAVRLWKNSRAPSPTLSNSSRLGLWFIVSFVLVRTAFLTQLETPEPRYVVVCFPAILALAAQLWARPKL